LLPRTLETLEDISEMESSLLNLQEETRGVLRIRVIPTIMPSSIAPTIHDFARLYPDLKIQLSERVTARLVQGVQAGQIDLAIFCPGRAGFASLCSWWLRVV
jgi:DNA-binding transcriptional LysR family regulator